MLNCTPFLPEINNSEPESLLGHDTLNMDLSQALWRRAVRYSARQLWVLMTHLH